MTDPVRAYAEAVIEGLIVAGPLVRAACRRHLRDLDEGPKRGLSWQWKKAKRALDFFPEVLRLFEGEHAGKPFILQPWQQFVIGSIFGWYGPDGFRRFRVAYIEAAKGAGKTPLSAGVGLYLLVADNEESAEIYVGATTRDQAGIAFRDAVRMVAASPELSSRITPSGSNPTYNLAHLRSGSFFRPVSAEGKALDGKRPHGVIIDELHEHPDGTVLEKLAAGFKGRRQPLMLMITNSGWDRSSVCFSYHEYSARAVEARPGDAGFDDQFFGLVFGLDEGDDPFESEDCWPKANPAIGITVTLDYLRKQVREAKGIPSKASLVRRLNFCMWTDAADPWIDGPTWRACEVDRVEFEGRDVVTALDLSGTRDLTALTIVSMDSEGIVDARVEFWTPGDTISSRSGPGQPPWRAWVDAGYIHAAPGRAVAYGDVAYRVMEIAQSSRLISLGFDSYQIKFFQNELDRLGLTLPLVAHPQGSYKSAESLLWMPHSIELLEKRLHEKTIRIERNPCLWYCVQCAETETDRHQNRTFSKKKSRGAIDGVVSLAMAIGVLETHRPEKPAPKYQMFSL